MLLNVSEGEIQGHKTIVSAVYSKTFIRYDSVCVMVVVVLAFLRHDLRGTVIKFA